MRPSSWFSTRETKKLTGNNCYDELVFDNVSRLNRLSPMNKAIANKIKHFPSPGRSGRHSGTWCIKI